MPSKTHAKQILHDVAPSLCAKHTSMHVLLSPMEQDNMMDTPDGQASSDRPRPVPPTEPIVKRVPQALHDKTHPIESDTMSQTASIQLAHHHKRTPPHDTRHRPHAVTLPAPQRLLPCRKGIDQRPDCAIEIMHIVECSTDIFRMFHRLSVTTNRLPEDGLVYAQHEEWKAYLFGRLQTPWHIAGRLQ